MPSKPLEKRDSGQKINLIAWLIIGLCIMLCGHSMPSAYAESTKEQLHKDIRVLDSSLNREEKKAAAMKEELRKLEKKMGKQAKKAYLLERKIKKISKRLYKAEEEKKTLQQELQVQKKGLSQQILALYSAGEQSHLRMLLKQDDPSDIGRTIKYFEYLNRSRIKKIQTVKDTLTKLHDVTEKIKSDKSKLQSLKENLLIEKKASETILARREKAYKKVARLVKNKQQRLREMKRKEARLQSEINRLVARASQKRAAHDKAPKSTQQKDKQVKKVKPEKATKKVTSEIFFANRKFSSLRGKLSWPVKGKIIHSYGDRRNERQRWKGTVIAASGGSKVRAIARGKVEFAGWFTGYGYLVIIRHDNNYRSLYGYNRGVYVSAGQIVKGGTVIAAVGNSGGQQKNALYFEIRKGSAPRNPAKWCR